MRISWVACGIVLATAILARSGLNASPAAPPQMTWQGQVGGTVFLYIQGKHVKIEHKDGGQVSGQHFRFNFPLPDTHQDVRVQVLEGRGYVHVVEQPRADNGFTVALAIEDRQAGASAYSLAFYWTGDDSGRRDRVTWTGRVDGEALISCARSACTSQAVSGAGAMHEKAKFSGVLPQSPVAVTLETLEGRGEVKVVEQPSEGNGYTARVRIHNVSPGASDYAFSLTWPRPSVSATSDLPEPQRRGLLWSARVAGTIRVTVRGGSAFSEAFSGSAVTGERVIFDRPLPASSGVKPVATKIQGSGTVQMIEAPSQGNGYQFVFEIRSTAANPEIYEVEVAW